jgi:hypothetical protein
MRRPITLMLFLSAAAAAARAEVPSLPPPPTSLLAPPVEPRSPSQPVYGPIFRVLPAHRLAMLEAGASLPEDNPAVQGFALLLSQATARYVEDAPAIADLIARTCLALRATNRPASPQAMIEAALAALKLPSAAPAGVPRSFEAFAARYYETQLAQPVPRAETAPARPVAPPAPSPAPPPPPPPARP